MMNGVGVGDTRKTFVPLICGFSVSCVCVCVCVCVK